MKDISRKAWAFDANERFVIDYLEASGFDVTVKRRTITADVLHVRRDGYEEDFRLPLDPRIDYPRYMAQYEKQFVAAAELDRLRRFYWEDGDVELIIPEGGADNA